MPTRHSGLQKDVLKLYRDLHRAARKKDPLNVNNFTSVVMQEFRIKAASVTKTDFKTIEHLLRYGYKQKKLIEMPGFRTGGVTSSSKQFHGTMMTSHRTMPHSCHCIRSDTRRKIDSNTCRSVGWIPPPFISPRYHQLHWPDGSGRF